MKLPLKKNLLWLSQSSRALPMQISQKQWTLTLVSPVMIRSRRKSRLRRVNTVMEKQPLGLIQNLIQGSHHQPLLLRMSTNHQGLVQELVNNSNSSQYHWLSFLPPTKRASLQQLVWNQMRPQHGWLDQGCVQSLLLLTLQKLPTGPPLKINLKRNPGLVPGE